MTNIRFDQRVGGGSIPLIGAVELKPTRTRYATGTVTMPAPQIIGLNNGMGLMLSVTPSPSGPAPEWAYRATIHQGDTGQSWSWLVTVPDVPLVDFADLTKPTEISSDLVDLEQITQELSTVAAAAASTINGASVEGDLLVMHRQDGTTFEAGAVRGLPGVNAVPADEAVATYLETEGTQTRTAITSMVMSVNDTAVSGFLNDPATSTHLTLTAKLNDVARIGPENMFAGHMAGALTDPTAVQGDPAFDGGYMNTFYGAEVGSKNLRGWKNTAFGTWALRNNEDGYNNVAIGDCALERNIGGVGSAKPSNTDPGSRLVAIGSYALRYNTVGFANVAIGRNAAHTNVSGNYNTAVGTNAYSGQYSNGVGDQKTASFNTMLGYNAGFFTNADKNTAVGNQALYSNTTGVENTVIGSEAGYGVQTGSFNLIAGARALRHNPAGGSNTALGTGAMGNSTAGSRNTAVGTSALAVPTGGGSNVAVGYAAGSTTPGGNNYTTSIGTQAEANHNNSVALGYGTKTSAENQVALGNRSISFKTVTTTPAAPADGFVLWGEVISGKTQIRVRFATGAIATIAQEA